MNSEEVRPVSRFRVTSFDPHRIGSEGVNNNKGRSSITYVLTPNK